MSGASDLEKLAGTARAIGADTLVQTATELSGRLSGGRFYLAVLGQFKRGKSSLINALLGRAVLPFGVAPVTSVITIVRYGEVRHAVAHFSDGKQRDISLGEIPLYVTERENPDNQKSVVAVEIFETSEILETGLCLVDTPGVGSVFHGTNEMTRSFVPQIDAALVVLGADPPISGDELALVRDVAREIPDVIFVLNKSDRMSQPDRSEAIEFCQTVLRKHFSKPIEFYQVSASEVQQTSSPSRDWPRMAEKLRALSYSRADEMIERGFSRGIRRIKEQLESAITDRERALRLDGEQIAEKLGAIRRCKYRIEKEFRGFGYIFDYRAHRLEDRLNRETEAFLKTRVSRLEADWTSWRDSRASNDGNRNPSRMAIPRLIAEFTSATLGALQERLLLEADEAYREMSGLYLKGAEELVQGIDEVTGVFGTKGSRFHFPKSRIQADGLPSRVEDVRAGGVLGGLLAGDPNGPKMIRKIEEVLRSSSRKLTDAVHVQLDASLSGLGQEILRQLESLARSAEEGFRYAQARLIEGPKGIEESMRKLQNLRSDLGRIRGEHADRPA